MHINSKIYDITSRIIKRSYSTRKNYLSYILNNKNNFPQRSVLSCANLAHGFAASLCNEKTKLKNLAVPNIGIVSAYNDMLSAHAPYKNYPDIIKQVANSVGGNAQFAGGIPAMCDGITQGNIGMEISLFSRDNIAMSTVIALSHNMFDAVLCLGVCDKIVPGLLIGVLQFGYLPTIFIPAGPMSSSIILNSTKTLLRQQFAIGKISKKTLLEAECNSYHEQGTCTFYGTANSNQLLMEIMGLHLPGSAFIHPKSPLRLALTKAATIKVLEIGMQSNSYIPIANVISEKTIVNGIIGLLATGGSTNHTLHLVAIARAAGIIINWDDFNDLSQVIPLLAHIYPNGKADINHFHIAGGTAFLIRELLDAGLLHEDVLTITGEGLRKYTQFPVLKNNNLVTWQDTSTISSNLNILRPLNKPFSSDGGLRLVNSRLGRGIMKVSALKDINKFVRAQAKIFTSQNAVRFAFNSGELDCDFVAVVLFQGPSANGMPELHSLMPILGAIQDRGKQVALLTDGRISGASGKVPSVIHLIPEALLNGPISKIRNGDFITLDAKTGILNIEVDDVTWKSRSHLQLLSDNTKIEYNSYGTGLFKVFRNAVMDAEHGASVFGSIVGENE